MFTALRLLAAAAVLCPLVAGAADGPGEPNETLLFVGGAGGDDTSPTLARLKARLEALDPKHGVVVFTGNYGDGELPAEGEAGRAHAEAHLLAHVEATRAFVARGGRVYFLPGNRDFAGGGARAVQRLRGFLSHSFEAAIAARSAPDAEDLPDLDVMPQASCADTTLVELNDNLGLLLVNSQWWMQDPASDPQANEGCGVKTRAAFGLAVTEAMSGYRSRRLVIASHHALRSYGEYGGSFTAGAHLSPLPVIGSVCVLARQAGLVEQYQNHPLVHSYVQHLLGQAELYGAHVFVSGHDANLQYLQVERQTQLISGTSGRAAQPTIAASQGDFASATPGWAELTFEPSGAGEASLVSGEADGAVLFRTTLPPLAPPGVAPAEPPPPVPAGPVLATFSKHDVWQLNGAVKFFVGHFNTDAYALKLPWEVLNLETEQGGLTPRGIGGGMQTNSVKLRDAQGNDWSMRGVTKDSSRNFPWPMNQSSVVNRFYEHGFTAIQPEAALAVPRLADALGVLHTEPRLMYLPDQAALGRYRGFLLDELVLLERRPGVAKQGALPESLVGQPSPEGKTHFRTTQEYVDRMLDKPGKHRVDQEAMLRARLLDMFIGDRDRHEGQWRFAATPNPDGSHTYRPIARDRDGAFANYDGMLFFFARIAAPTVRVLQPFDGDYPAAKWVNYGARHLDSYTLNQLPRDRWLANAQEARAALTDQVIDEALSTWHPETYALGGARLAEALRSRRDKLVDFADEHFAVVNENADVLGSTHDDTFELWFMDHGAIRVTVRDTGKDGADNAPYFDRVYEPSQTDELRLYALEGNDALYVHGEPSAKIDVRFVGGQGSDVVSAMPSSRAAPMNARAMRVYDSEDGLTIDPSITVWDERSSLARLNEYDGFENHDPDYGAFFPGLKINPDDGVFIGGQYAYTVQGYKKHPYGARHELGATFATATLGFALDYRGLFPQSGWLFDQQLDLVVKSPTFTRNFYGLTNQLVPNVAAGDYYRVRQAWYEARYGVTYRIGGDWSRVGGQLFGQRIVTEATPGRFVAVSPDVSGALGQRYFLGARVLAETNTFDDPVLPTRGVALHASAESRYDVEHGDQLSLGWRASGALAVPFDRQRRFVLLTRAAVEGIVGDHPFYFAPTLGGTDLRAYHLQQLAGEVAFAQTTDLRIDVVRIYSVLPGTLGLKLSVDHGRVFGPSITSNAWHLNYGGGVWWSVLNVVALSANYYRGLDGGSRFVFSLGPLFSQEAL